MPEFVRAIGLGRATAMVVGTIIGASIFVQPSLVSAAVSSPGGVLLVWAAAGALTLIGALITAELSSAFPQTGGVYVFLKRAYSPAVAYLWGWAMFWSMHSGIIAAIATVFARYLGHFIELGDAGTRAAAVGAIIVLSAVNYFGVRQGSALQTFFTVIKLAALLLVVAMGVYFLTSHGGAADAGSMAHPDAGRMTYGAVVQAMVAGLFAYGGWHMVTYAAEETRDATRTIPRALLIGTVVVTIAYIAVNASYLAVLPLQQVTSSTRVAADFADAVLGSGGAHALSALVVLSTLGGMTGIILAGPRVYLAMADDGLLFRWIGSVHPTYRTPHVAIALQAVWSCVLVLTGTYRALFTRVVYTEWIFFALMAASVLFLRRRADYRPAYRVWGFPVLPAIFVGSSAAIVLHQIVTQPAESLTGLALVAAGLPVYWLWTRRRPVVVTTLEPDNPTTRS
ncbi:MAG TPA: amino acid permease [Gemmatimonadaceae bacterium]|nr:amino acid permease [Gemmatimonadaceae bacterium]